MKYPMSVLHMSCAGATPVHYTEITMEVSDLLYLPHSDHVD